MTYVLIVVSMLAIVALIGWTVYAAVWPVRPDR